MPSQKISPFPFPTEPAASMDHVDLSKASGVSLPRLDSPSLRAVPTTPAKKATTPAQEKNL